MNSMKALGHLLETGRADGLAHCLRCCGCEIQLEESCTRRLMRTHRALSIRQPWTWCVVRPDLAGEARRAAIKRDEIKLLENRTWDEGYSPFHFRGRFLIHASKGMTEREYNDVLEFLPGGIELPAPHALERGGIVGIATVRDIIRESDSYWFTGPVALMLEEIEPLPFEPCRGMLGFFQPEIQS